MLLILALKRHCKRSNTHPRGDEKTKDETRRMLGVSALCFLQCFDTVGWVTERTSGLQENIYRLSLKVPFRNKWRETQGGSS